MIDTLGRRDLKLNLGCGNAQLDGYINIDMSPGVLPDLVMDLNQPHALSEAFHRNSVVEIYSSHALEHLDNVVQVVEDMWTVSAPGALWRIIVPHRRADMDVGNPFHRSPIFTEWTFRFFSPHSHPHPIWGGIMRGTAHEQGPTTLEEVEVQVRRPITHEPDPNGHEIQYVLRVVK